MNKKDLLNIGIEDEDVVQKIIVLHGKDIEKLKSDLDAKVSEMGALTTQLQEAGQTIEGFKKLDVVGIQKAADDYKAAAEKATTDAELRVASLKFDHALEGELKSARAKDPADIVPHLKKDMLKLGEDGKLLGLSEQLTPLQESKPYLFEHEDNDEEQEPRIVAKTTNQGILGDATVSAARKAAELPYA